MSVPITDAPLAHLELLHILLACEYGRILKFTPAGEPLGERGRAAVELLERVRQEIIKCRCRVAPAAARSRTKRRATKRSRRST